MKEKELSAQEIVSMAMKDLCAMEGMIQILEAILAEPASKEEMMAMLREMRKKRGELEDAVKEFTTVDVAAQRLETYDHPSG